MSYQQLQHAIKVILAEIVEHADPDRVILFGSAAQGASSTVNDLDFLVIVPDSKPPSRVLDTLNLNIRNKPMPCDFLVATPEVLNKSGNNLNSVYNIALRDGREVYVK